MCDHWMPTITLALTMEQYRQLPRHPAYRYEYLNGKAILSPNSRHYHAMLDLATGRGPAEAPSAMVLRPVLPSDIVELVPVFAAAFRDIQPFGSLESETRKVAAEEALHRTITGGDGPWIEKASFVAVEKDKPVAAIFFTLLPDGDPTDWDSYRWNDPPPLGCIERRLGRPHLTWIFVSPHSAGTGIGSALLEAGCRELLALGYAQLLSTFVIGNASSMLWHWRNGFRLLAYPGSKRLMRQRLQEKQI
jgi:GNAT superfamily N-acetyltransferase